MSERNFCKKCVYYEYGPYYEHGIGSEDDYCHCSDVWELDDIGNERRTIGRELCRDVRAKNGGSCCTSFKAGTKKEYLDKAGKTPKTGIMKLLCSLFG